MEDSSNKRMKAGNLNASLEAIESLVGAHEHYHDTPYYQEVQVDTRRVKFSKVPKSNRYNRNMIINILYCFNMSLS